MNSKKKYSQPGILPLDFVCPTPLAISGGSGGENQGTLLPEDEEFNGTFQSQHQQWEKSAWQE